MSQYTFLKKLIPGFVAISFIGFGMPVMAQVDGVTTAGGVECPEGTKLIAKYEFGGLWNFVDVDGSQDVVKITGDPIAGGDWESDIGIDMVMGTLGDTVNFTQNLEGATEGSYGPGSPVLLFCDEPELVDVENLSVSKNGDVTWSVAPMSEEQEGTANYQVICFVTSEAVAADGSGEYSVNMYQGSSDPACVLLETGVDGSLDFHWDSMAVAE
ncbi:MAG: hypothetical protein SVR94_18485 [Pseudomonadota bacterium]|nr:hypothetical protein [Pseudomonadota bacterium]